MNLQYLRQYIDELRKCKDDAKRTTRSKEQAYLEKCREFVEILIDSNVLYEFAEAIVDSSSSSCNNNMDMSIDEPTISNTSNIQHGNVDVIDNTDTDILNQYHVDCNNYYMSIINQYETDSLSYYTSLFDKYRVDNYDYYTSIINQYQVDSETYYAELLNQYQANSEAYYTSILNQYQTENEKYYTEYNKTIAEYCVWYEKELNEYYTDCYTEYYTDCLQKLCWQYYNNAENNQITVNKELVIKNRDLVAHNKTLKEFETKYNSLFIQNKNTTMLLNSMKNEYKEIYRRLMIMISQYNKLYIEFEKYKKTGVVGDVDIENNKDNTLGEIPEIPDDYDYIDLE